MDGQINNELKILENKLYLLDLYLLITPKRKGQHAIAYSMDILHSPTLEMQILSNSIELLGALVERTAVIDYVKDAKLSSEKSKDNKKL